MDTQQHGPFTLEQGYNHLIQRYDELTAEHKALSLKYDLAIRNLKDLTDTLNKQLADAREDTRIAIIACRTLRAQALWYKAILDGYTLHGEGAGRN